MKVKEFIQKLQEMNQEAEVYFLSGGPDAYYPAKEPEAGIIVDDYYLCTCLQVQVYSPDEICFDCETRSNAERINAVILRC